MRMVGVFGRERTGEVESALAAAFGSTSGRVLVDLTDAVHIHDGLASLLVTAARFGGRLDLVGPNPCVRQILRLAGALEEDVYDDWNLGEGVREASA